MAKVEITREDCMDLMVRYPDKHFDLTLTDPPYGIGQEWKKRKTRHNGKHSFPETSYKNDCIPDKSYFEELMRVSKQQIIFGYNYFVEILGPTNYLIIWDKCVTDNSYFLYSQAEIAYSSIKKPIQVFHVPWDGWQMGKETSLKKIHPHQKPVDLFIRILRKYALPGWKILDTHMGSGSTVIACHRLGLDVCASEIDETYYKAAKKRIDFEIKQKELFSDKEIHSDSLFAEFNLSPCA